jgi:ribosomal protein S27E
MTVTFRADIFCDGCGTWIETGVSGGKASGLIARAVKVAKKTGWSRDTKSMYLDVCPDCLKKIHRGGLT